MATHFASGPSSRMGTNTRIGVSPSSSPSDSLANGTEAVAHVSATSPASDALLNGTNAEAHAAALPSSMSPSALGTQAQSLASGTSPLGDSLIGGTHAQRDASQHSTLSPTPEPTSSSAAIAGRTRKQLNASTTIAAQRREASAAATDDEYSSEPTPSAKKKRAQNGEPAPWTEEQDKALLESIRHHTKDWPAIMSAFAKALPQASRTQQALMSRWQKLKRREKKAALIESQDAPLAGPSGRDTSQPVLITNGSADAELQDDDCADSEEENCQERLIKDDAGGASTSVSSMPTSSKRKRAVASTSKCPFTNSVKKRPPRVKWTQFEDDVLSKCLKEYGSDWDRIIAEFVKAAPESHRTAAAIRARYNYLCMEIEESQRRAGRFSGAAESATPEASAAAAVAEPSITANRGAIVGGSSQQDICSPYASQQDASPPLASHNPLLGPHFDESDEESSEDEDNPDDDDYVASLSMPSSSTRKKITGSTSKKASGSTRAPGVKWTQAEDDVLIKCVDDCQRDWALVPAAFAKAAPQTPRTAKALKLRYYQVRREGKVGNQKQTSGPTAKRKAGELATPAASEAGEESSRAKRAKRRGRVDTVEAAEQPEMARQSAAAEEVAAAEEPASLEEPAVAEESASPQAQAIAEGPAAIEDHVVAEEAAVVEGCAAVEGHAAEEETEESAEVEKAAEVEGLAASEGSAAAEDAVMAEYAAGEEPSAGAQEQSNAQEPAAPEDLATVESRAVAGEPTAEEESAMVESPAASVRAAAADESATAANASAGAEQAETAERLTPRRTTLGSSSHAEESSSFRQAPSQSNTGGEEECYEDEAIHRWSAEHGFSANLRASGAASATTQHQAPPQAEHPEPSAAGPSHVTQGAAASNPHLATPEVSSRALQASPPVEEPPLPAFDVLIEPGLFHFRNCKRGSRIDFVAHNRYQIHEDQVAQQPLPDKAAVPFSFYIFQDGFVGSLRLPEGTNVHNTIVRAEDGSGEMTLQSSFVSPHPLAIIFSSTVL